LAYLGDFTTLEEYARIFEKGFRLNFAPMITREVIEAALAVSYDYFVTRQGQAEPSASPNGDPAEPLGNSDVGGGPPSES
jgi:hypothetical protein